jgi:glycosyltransferase involved in cell wall biosynthesis
VSIVVPAYNEERFIGKVIESIEAVTQTIEDFLFEVIVVDDGSTDSTFSIVSSISYVRSFTQRNKGKGSAVQHGISKSMGEYILIQDADLEYDVKDYKELLSALRVSMDNDRVAIYGSRTIYKKSPDSGETRYRFKPIPGQSLGPWFANIVLSATVGLLYGRWISDTLTAYKLYRKSFFDINHIYSAGFEADHEITAKLLNQGFQIIEVPVAYSPRSIEEGKKIRPKDGIVALKVYLIERIRELVRGMRR